MVFSSSSDLKIAAFIYFHIIHAHISTFYDSLARVVANCGMAREQQQKSKSHNFKMHLKFRSNVLYLKKDEKFLNFIDVFNF